MNTKAILITIFALLLLVVAYVGYEYYLKNDKVELWALVPSSAVAVYQRGSCGDCVDSIQRAKIGELLQALELRSGKEDTSYVSLFKKMTRDAVLVSVHRTTKNNFEFVFYHNKSEVPALSGTPGKNRVYEGLTIGELSVNGKSISWVDVESYRIVSVSPVLVEDGIRAFRKKETDGFRDGLKKIRSAPNVKNDGGDLVVNLQEVGKWLSLFTSNEQSTLNLSGWSMLDVKQQGPILTLNGFTEADTADVGILGLFDGQAPVQFKMKNFVSNDALYAIGIGISDAVSFGKALKQKKNGGNFLSNSDREQLYEGVDQEIVLVSVEVGAGNSAPVVMVGIKGSGKWPEILQRVSEAAAKDTIATEQYSDFLIGRIDGDFIGDMLPIFGLKVDKTYYTQLGNAILLAADLRALKKILDDVEQENVWSKSIEKNKFLESTLLESNINFFIDPTKSGKFINDLLSPEWREYIRKTGVTNKIGLSAIQFSRLNERFYTSISITGNGEKKNSLRTEKEVFVTLSTGVAGNPIVAKNHNDKSWELFVQDSSKNLYLIDKQGKTLWKKQLDGFVKGEAHQIDYFSNGKLQLLMSTERTLYLVDRLGNDVSGFPKPLAATTELLNIVDYDHSRKYRYAFSDKKGVVRMTDKEGVILEGWSGLAMGGEMLTTPKHYRISNKDYISFLRKDGQFFLFNRRGEKMKGFPVDLKSRVRDDYFLKEEKNEKPYFVFVNTDGFRIKLSLQGEEISRETIVKPTMETSFRLVNEENEKLYVVVRQNNKSLSVLNESLGEVVTNSFIGMNNTEIRVYDFGTGNVFYTIVDLAQDLGYVYDSGGRLLTEQPIECQRLCLAYEKGVAVMISTFDDQINIRYLQ